MKKLHLNNKPSESDITFIEEWVLRQTDKNADELMADMLLHEMLAKLALKRKQGRGGWYGPNCNNQVLLRMLRGHLDKGDMVDIANFAGMILARQRLFGEKTVLQNRNQSIIQEDIREIDD